MCILGETSFTFFFQAEDGIRDAQESRGLGDVYKRQGYDRALAGYWVEEMKEAGFSDMEKIPQTAYAFTLSLIHI